MRGDRPSREGDSTRRAEVRMELHRARAAVIAAVEVRRLAVAEVEVTRGAGLLPL